ncbi:MAG: phosphoribosylformylglycinamidine synthase subunit PurQ [Bdellovibrionales bacterium]|nr:phosphoribosylformylglycinamidine synthase subunit PurQ [Bdellovibrionales bacterium]
MSKKVLVLTGDGINCERETAKAFQDVGAIADIIHVNTLLKNPKTLLNYQIFALPGGFSFGDELKSGKILAEKMRETLMEIFAEFNRKGGLTIGICNGFQILIQLGVFEKNFGSADRHATLSTNDHGTFLNRWVRCTITDQAAKSPWFKGMSGTIMMPMRHKEGRIQLKGEFTAHIPLRYTEDVNGAYNQGAALLDPSGQIFGLMPHPEAAMQDFLNSLDVSTAEKTVNAKMISQFFKNAVGS